MTQRSSSSGGRKRNIAKLSSSSRAPSSGLVFSELAVLSLVLDFHGLEQAGPSWKSGELTYYPVKGGGLPAMTNAVAVPLWVSNPEKAREVERTVAAYHAMSSLRLAPHIHKVIKFRTGPAFKSTLLVLEHLDGGVEEIEPMDRNMAKTVLPLMLKLAYDCLLSGLRFGAGPDSGDFLFKGDLAQPASIKLFVAPYMLSLVPDRIRAQLTKWDVARELDPLFDHLQVNMVGGIVKRGSGGKELFDALEIMRDRLIARDFGK